MDRLAARARALGVALGTVVLAGAVVGWLWGFMVDDAWLVTRIAWHLAHGIGYRFNVGGPIVDAVTPLGFANWIALWPARTPLGMFGVAKAMGAAAWLSVLGGLGYFADRAGTRPQRYLPVGLAALSAPGAAWAVSGLETGLVTGLCGLALLPGRGARWAAGAAAAWRPELVPWAVVQAFGTALVASTSRLRRAEALLAALLPAIGVALVRSVVFGHPAPLAVFAKPSDLAHGAFYVAGALLWAGVPWLCLAPLGWRVLEARQRVVAVAILVHWIAVACAGGDWMPLFRLLVPVFPSCVYLGVFLAERGHRIATALRVAVAAVVTVAILVDRGPEARGVGPDRERLVRAAEPHLRGARRVATVDAGWVGLASDGDIVDLTGVTNEAVAVLPGGHTSKRIPSGFFERQGVDTLVMLVSGRPDRVDWRASEFARQVELRSALLSRDLPFALTAALPVAGGSFHYLILRLEDEGPPARQ